MTQWQNHYLSPPKPCVGGGWCQHSVYITNTNCVFLEEEYFFEVAEAVFVGWFSFEYVIRFVAAPQKVQWVSQPMRAQCHGHPGRPLVGWRRHKTRVYQISVKTWPQPPDIWSAEVLTFKHLTFKSYPNMKIYHSLNCLRSFLSSGHLVILSCHPAIPSSFN